VGGLAAVLDERTRSALACGAMRPICTEQTEIDDRGVRFLVRVVSSLARKAQDSGLASPGAKTDPFLPPEPALTVAQLGKTHVAVLNKFNVLDRHLLIVTRAFEHQETLLTPQDLHALFACMAQMPSLGFYNGGTLAGASQSHKHLQLVPLPLTADGPTLPMAPLLADGPRAGPGISLGTCPGLPFRHAFARLSRPVAADIGLAREAHGVYRALLEAIGVGAVAEAGQLRQSAPYNLLVAEDWLLAVPRMAECFHSVSVNALGFAGSLFVKNREGLALVRAAGPMTVLREVVG
jgi:sulfate adenylyltransferase (ADP) / ATP adenylyltransferase